MKREEVLEIDDSDDIIDRFAVDRKARESLLVHDPQDLVNARAGLDRYDVRPRHHDFLDDGIGEAEDAVDQVLFGRFENTPFPSFPDQVFDLILGNEGLFGLLLQAEKAAGPHCWKQQGPEAPRKGRGRGCRRSWR